MEESLIRRLAALKDEYDKGQHQLELLDRQRQELRDTMLRISGAIQVLQELSTQQHAEIKSQS